MMQQRLASMWVPTFGLHCRCQRWHWPQVRRVQVLQLSPSVKNHQFYPTVRCFTQSTTQDEGLRKLRRYKRVFAISLFTGTLVFAWFLKRQKGLRLKDLLEDFTRIPVDESSFGASVSLYRYKGFIFPGQMVMSGVFQELPHFEFRDDDVVVASYPKAGTTWIQEIVYMLTHDFKRSDASSESLETRFPYLEYPYPGIKSITAKQGPRYIKTHLPLSLLPPSLSHTNAKLIYISRNPRDVAVSYYYFMRLLTQCSYQGSFSNFITMFLNDTLIYSPFFEHVLEYWRARRNPNILFLSYEQLHQDPVKVVKEIAEFLNVDATNEEVNFVVGCTSFGSMSKNPSVNYEHWKDLGFAHKDQGKFFRKGEVGNWKHHLNNKEVVAFEKWEKEHLLNTGLDFIYTL